MMYLVFLLGFYLGGMSIPAIVLYFGIPSVNVNEPRAKMLINEIGVLLIWPIVMPIAAYRFAKDLKN